MARIISDYWALSHAAVSWAAGLNGQWRESVTLTQKASGGEGRGQ